VKARYAAVVLAGGFSTRMQQFKPLLPLGEETITDHVISTFLSEGVDVLLVAGYRQHELRSGIRQRNITVVDNPDYEQGMFSSVRAGVSHLEPWHQAFFLLPVDIPLVRQATISRMLATAEDAPGRIIYPVFGGRRGHPPLIPASLVPTILSWDKEGGLKTVLDSRRKTSLEIIVPDSNILFDIDTQEDYDALLKRFQNYEIPTDEECKVILNDVCQVTPERIQHCLKVAEVAVAIGKALEKSGRKVNVEIVRLAAMLHDIAKGQRKHDIAGGRILRELGFGKVGDIIAVHSDLAGGDTHLSLESKIVYLADKFVRGEKLVTIEERYHHPDWTPEVQKRVLERRKVALSVKREFENLIGCSLEKVIHV
jgi:molybdenum cofactor cytidylyltransferase